LQEIVFQISIHNISYVGAVVRQITENVENHTDEEREHRHDDDQPKKLEYILQSDSLYDLSVVLNDVFGLQRIFTNFLKPILLNVDHHLGELLGV
jgi:hypothetical protein